MLGSDYSILLAPYDAVFIDIAKVASSSLKAVCASVLGMALGADGDPHDVDYPRPPPAAPHGRPYPGLHTFAFVRNPWDRVVSCYRDKILGEVSDFTTFADAGIAHCLTRFDAFRPGMTFDAFVRAIAAIDDAVADEHFRSQIDYLVDDDDRMAVDFVGRFENLAADFATVSGRIGLPANARLPRLQAAPPADYRSFYRPATRDLVARRFCRDIERFGYSFT